MSMTIIRYAMVFVSSEILVTVWLIDTRYPFITAELIEISSEQAFFVSP